MIEIKECVLEDVLEIRHKVMWPQKDKSFVKVSGDKSAKHLGLYVDDKLISIISLFEDHNNLQFRKFATLLEYQNKGYGTLLLSEVMNYAKNHAYEMIWCNARVDAIPFYKKFGLQETCGVFSKSDQDYTIMIKDLTQ